MADNRNDFKEEVLQKENTKKNKEVMSNFKKEIYSLLETTTAHALPNIVRSESYFIKLVWLLLFLGFFSYSIYSLIIMVSDFLEYNVLIKYELRQQFDDLEFPTVTICPLSPYDFANTTQLKTVLDLLKKTTTDPGKYFLASNNQTLCSSSLKQAQRIQQTITDFGSYSLTLDKLILSCQYNDRPCNQTQTHYSVNN